MKKNTGNFNGDNGRRLFDSSFGIHGKEASNHFILFFKSLACHLSVRWSEEVCLPVVFFAKTKVELMLFTGSAATQNDKKRLQREAAK